MWLTYILINITNLVVRFSIVMKQKVSLICLIVTAIVKIAVFLSLVIIWRWKRGTHASKVESTTCIGNNTFLPLAGESDMTKGIEKRGDKFCGELSDLLDRMVEQMVVEKYDSNLSPETPNLNLSVVDCTPSLEKLPSLRLEEITSQAEPVQEKASKVYWRPGMTTVPDALIHLEEDGSVYIKKAGQYYVSSQLTLETESINKNNTDGINDVYTKHIVYAISHEKREHTILMERVKSPCQITTDRLEQTSHMAAVFNFQEKDRIFVAISHPRSLVRRKGRNYFTVHSIY